MKEREIFWFIFTNDAYTNESISRELPAEDVVLGALCQDGLRRNLWKCDGQFVSKMKRNEKQSSFHFQIFKKEGRYGTIKLASFLDKKKKKQRV